MRKPVLFTMLFMAAVTTAQPGSLDPTFADAGIRILAVNQSISSASDLLTMDDNTLVVVGTAYTNDTIRGTVTHLLNDGSIDGSFGDNGATIFTAGSSTILDAVARADDGGILVAGATFLDDEGNVLMAKLLPNGQLDPSFGAGGLFISDVNGAEGRLLDLFILDDGRILACGWTLDGNSSTNGLLMRFNANGTLDDTFSNDGILVNTNYSLNDALEGITVLEDGSILAAGTVNVSDNPRTLLLKCDASGTLDLGFGGNGTIVPEFNAGRHGAKEVIASDGDFVVCGYLGDAFNVHDAYVARFGPDGSLDSTFGTDGLTRIDTAVYDGATDLIRDALGNIVLCGYTGESNGSSPRDVLLARLMPDGMRDLTFGTNGLVITSAGDGPNEANAIAIQPDSRIVVAGQAIVVDTGYVVVARYLHNACAVFPAVSPESLVLCPNGAGELTTSPFDTYQWYKNGLAIPGATSQTLAVASADDAGSWFKVETSIDTCSAFSDSVLVDGYVFLLPTIINNGDQPNAFGDDGEQLFCDGDTALLTLGQPYDTNIQWYDFGVPIPGANSTVLAVAGSGSYSVQGAPAVCPAFMQDAGVTITTEFRPIIQPVVVESGILYCPEPEGLSAQWYFNGNPFVGLEQCCIPLFSGDYTVLVDYGDSCSVLSEPFFLVGVEELSFTDMKASPVPTADRVTVTWSQGEALLDWRVIDATGRVVASGVKATSPLRLELDDLDVGRYRFLSGDGRSLPLLVVR